MKMVKEYIEGYNSVEFNFSLTLLYSVSHRKFLYKKKFDTYCKDVKTIVKIELTGYFFTTVLDDINKKYINIVTQCLN